MLMGAWPFSSSLASRMGSSLKSFLVPTRITGTLGQWWRTLIKTITTGVKDLLPQESTCPWRYCNCPGWPRRSSKGRHQSEGRKVGAVCRSPPVQQCPTTQGWSPARQPVTRPVVPWKYWDILTPLNIGRVVVENGRDVLVGESIGCVAYQETGLSCKIVDPFSCIVRVACSLPTAPSPTTTHLIACMSRQEACRPPGAWPGRTGGATAPRQTNLPSQYRHYLLIKSTLINTEEGSAVSNLIK